MASSYWMNASVRTEQEKAAALSWFKLITKGGEEVESARIQVDAKTDREKKIEIIVAYPDGKRQRLTRSRRANGDVVFTWKKLH